MAASTVNDDLARELDLLRADNLELRAQVSALVDVITPGPTGGDITALYAGGVTLDNAGLTLPLPLGSETEPGAIIWRDSSFDSGNKAFQHQIVLQGFASVASSLNLFLSNQVGAFSSISEPVTFADWSAFCYAKASTAPESTLTMYSQISLDAQDTSQMDVYALDIGQRGPSTNHRLMVVRKETVGFDGLVPGADYTIGLFTDDPDSDASLDIDGKKALLLPRMTSANKDATTLANGMLFYNTDSSRLIAFVGGAERILSSG